MKKELTAILVPGGDARAHGRCRPTTRSAGTPPTPTRCGSRTCACPRPTCSASAAAASRSFIETLDEGRVAFAALCTGAAQGCLEEAMRYAKSRNVFGHPIGENQHIAFTIARMQARVHSARLAWLRRRAPAGRRAAVQAGGQPRQADRAARRRWTTRATPRRSSAATAFMNENPVARHYRDSKILEIGEGTTEVQLMVIARELGLRGCGCDDAGTSSSAGCTTRSSSWTRATCTGPDAR